MSPVILAFAIGLALGAVSKHAVPLAPKPAAIALGAVPPVELVDLAYGWGWHRAHCQDHWGYWHWHCVPNGHGYQDHGTRLEHPTQIGEVRAAVGQPDRDGEPRPADDPERRLTLRQANLTRGFPGSRSG
jgi:hypothetical protein